MAKNNKTTVAIYARVSTTDKGQNPKNQLEQLRRWCRSQGYRIFKEYVDHESGRKGAADRAAFREMFDAAARHEFDLVLVWSLDRLTREGLAHTVAYLRKLQTYGVRLPFLQRARGATQPCSSCFPV